MHFSLIAKILGMLLMLFGTIATMLPIMVSLYYADGSVVAFAQSFVYMFVLGFIMWASNYRSRGGLSTRDGFLLVTLFWAVLGSAGSLPLIFGSTQLSVVDAVFESISGLTATGASVISGLDALPQSILFYRQLLHWMGGMGIIVLAMALLPMLGVGGMQLYRAEAPGPVKDTKLVPRLAETAKALWIIYLALTVTCAAAFWLAGMSLFDAIAHSFSTIAIGGFSTHDASFGYFDSRAIEFVGILFMFLAGVNFALHFVAWRGRSLSHYLRDSELKFYLLILLVVSTVTISVLNLFEVYPTVFETFIKGLFHVVSFSTTTGFSTGGVNDWPIFLPYLLVYIGMVGACAGSTSGGIKVIRVLLFFKQGLREITRLIHPHAVIPIKLGRVPVRDSVTDAVWGFFAVYIASIMVMMLALVATGVDLITAFSAVAACINNLGIGIAGVAGGFGVLTDSAKWILSFAMLFGRLELFTLIVLFTPMFWRR